MQYLKYTCAASLVSFFTCRLLRYCLPFIYIYIYCIFFFCLSPAAAAAAAALPPKETWTKKKWIDHLKKRDHQV